jgi:hypothetical protein
MDCACVDPVESRRDWRALRVHFGLGAASLVDRLDVRWPNGREERWDRLAADRIHTLREGTARGNGEVTHGSEDMTSVEECA